MEENYYWSDDFSPTFYVKLAKKGFISTSIYNEKELLLLPEMQFSYAILDFKHLHVSRKVKKLLRLDNYHFSINQNFPEVLEKIEHYHEDSWLQGEYKTMLLNLFHQDISNFKLISVELKNKENELISGEVGYIIGQTYTSLTGFTSKEKRYNNWGKLQLVLLAHYLEEKKFDFWNLGHACLQYKIDLGAKVYGRKEFLKRWLLAT